MAKIEIRVREDIELGTWQGMGGAITEATAYNFSKLSSQKQEELLDAYYGRDGLDYRWGRISIGSNDFCLKPFEYTRRRDLRDFSIEHDKKWVLPMLKRVLKMKNLTLIASPWSPPSCLKTTQILKYGGHLLPWRYGTYARYIRKWLEAYEGEGVKVAFLTPQNEPRAVQTWESCVYSYRAQKRLAYKYLAKELAQTDTRILLWDHNKKELTKVAECLLQGKYAEQVGRNEKVAGLCFHWYEGTHPEQMWRVREQYPEIMMVSSEMCCGFSPYNAKSWANAANPYYYELLSDINCGASAWVDWNMLLSWGGGPTHVGNCVASPVILNRAEDDFILTPIYDALKKFAKMFPVGSKVVRCENPSDKVAAVARKTQAGYEVVVAKVSDEDECQEVAVTVGGVTKIIELKKLEIGKLKFGAKITKQEANQS
ncbi:hypothetical protein IKF15_01810 [Candidatus Saccharibacteria bacterium]|nr:hypothetical protein [Candidatus Saccharibacteria bacterium]